MIPISICVIMKNEESHLPTFISSIKNSFGNYPYELLIVDTGSSDNSVNYAMENGANVIFFKWTDNFSEARNYGIARAQNDLILVLDCDEFITHIDTSSLESFYLNHKTSLGMISSIDSMQNTDSLFCTDIPRLFNRKIFRYIYPIHEQPRPYKNIDFDYVKFPLTVKHVGYNLEENALKEKAYRNINLLLKENNDPYVLFQIGQSYYMIHEYEKAVEYFEKACEFDVDPNLDYVQKMIISYGYSLLECKQYTNALAFENIYDAFAITADFVVLMGIIYLRTGNVIEAMEQFAKATTMENFNVIGSNSFIPFYNMGCINEVLGNFDEAIELYRKCGNYMPAVKRLEEIISK